MLIDTHVHLVSADERRYPRQLNGDADWVHTHACDASAYRVLMTAAGVTHAVLVQAVGAYRDDNRYCLDAANADPELFTAVAYVDLAATDPVEALRACVDAGAHGVRVVAAAGPDPVAMLDARVMAVIDAANGLGVRVLLTTMRDGLRDVPALLARHPTMPVAIDHCAFADLSGGASFPHAGALFALAEFPYVHLKVSTNALDGARRAGVDPQAFVAALAECFGAERLEWGSDWSHTHDRSFGELVAEAQDAFSVLDPDDREWPLGRSAAGFWPGWAPATEHH
ncbi:MAG: amidohydrolase family protein [Acidimicrobiia bacterium]